MTRIVTALIVASFIATLGARAAAAPSPAEQLISKLKWRSIGPYIGGRSVAVAGVPNEPNLFYFGGVEAGVWKSANYRTELVEHHRR